MGHKVNPTSLRLGINKDWKTRYYPGDNDWASKIYLDKKVRNYLFPLFKTHLVSEINIERNDKTFKVIIYSARAGMIYGEEGKHLAKLKKDIQIILKGRKLEVKMEVFDTPNPNLNATILANEIAVGLERRGSFRIVQKNVIRKALKFGAKGIKTQVAGRLNGVDMARTEGYTEGRVPLQTIRNSIDYARANAVTKYGIIGVKVWVSKGEVFGTLKEIKEKEKETIKVNFGYNNRKPFNKNR